jgi:dynactin complex subunit
VKWYGQITGAKGNWYGIELDNPKGKHNGTVNKVFYFESKDGHGMFFKAKHLIPYEDLNARPSHIEGSEDTKPTEEQQQSKPEE